MTGSILTSVKGSTKMKVRLAAIQPLSGSGADENRNATESLIWLRRAADDHADLVAFPEGYPGPINPSNNYDALEPLTNAAAEFGLHVIASRAVPFGAGYAVELNLIDDRGDIVGAYRRTTPRGPYVYSDIEAWNFDYVEANTPPRVFDTRVGRIGMLVCSELYSPELSRLLMLQGVDVIAYPAGGAINELLPGWRTLVYARAFENLVFTVACQNLYGEEEGVGIVAGPEGVLAGDRPGADRRRPGFRSLGFPASRKRKDRFSETLRHYSWSATMAAARTLCRAHREGSFRLVAVATNGSGRAKAA
jgi:predicted amidohydrolase